MWQNFDQRPGFSHANQGHIESAKMVQHECATEMIAYIPVFPPKGSGLECMAIVVLKTAHNHPVQPSLKPGVRDAMQLESTGPGCQCSGFTWTYGPEARKRFPCGLGWEGWFNTNFSVDGVLTYSLHRVSSLRHMG